MAIRRYYLFAHELGEIPLEDAGAIVSAILAADWGSWTAASAATVHTPIPAVLAATWGGWTGALTATVIPRIEATLAANWGAWDAEMTAVATAAPVIDAVLTAVWGAWTAALTATVKHEATLSATWGGWTGALTATVIPRIESVLAATWGGWTASMTTHVSVPVPAVLAAAWGGWTALSTSVVTPETEYLVASWGTWTAHLFGRPHTPPRTSPLVPYTLGCGVYEAYIKTRGGYTFVGRARNITNLKWSRVLNDVSEAEITFALNGDKGNCCDLAATINPWEHELAIYRDGGEVWTGPITGGKIDLNESVATFQAKDLFAWFDHRWVEVRDNDVEFEDADITELFLWLLDHGYWKDPFNLEWTMTGDRLNVPMTRTYVAATAPDRWGGVFQNVATELRDLVDAKIDFTTIRRTLIAGNLQQDSRVHPIQLLDQDWEKLPDIQIVGASMATEQGVGGSNAGYFGYDDDQMWIERPDDAYRSQFGLLQSFDSAAELDDIDTYESPNPITQRAFELREIRKKPFVYLSGGVMSRHAPIMAEQLIPGHHFKVSLNQTCRTVKSKYLLTRADFTFDGESEGIALELVPPGADMLKSGT